MSTEPPLRKSKQQNRARKTARSTETPSTQPEVLSPDERAEIALRLAAQEKRGRPPSI